jgi:predicted neuraminidase|uniref:Sialidase domain-containing protein n=1 Tax=Desulfobacca acetoxidans TaxID=60893 RepID=A0A7C5EQU4_9BACT
MNLSRKVFLSILLVLLYLVPFLQKQVPGAKGFGEGLKILIPEQETGPEGQSPYFAEYFVNEARPGVMCHVSSIAPTQGHKLLCIWYAGTREAASDVAIYGAFFDLKLKTWSAPQVLLTPEQSSRELRRLVRKLGNAVAFNDSRGGLWLFYAAMVYGGWSATSLHYKVSWDGGLTWSPSRKLVLSPFFNLTNNLKNQGIILSQGAFLLPVYQEFIYKFSQLLLCFPGKSGLYYELRPLIKDGSAIQPSLIPVGPRGLTAFFRNGTNSPARFILRAVSSDLGRTWSDLTPTTLPHPGSGMAMTSLAEGAILGVINHSFKDRSNLTLVLSRDGGATWETLKTLENAPGREYSYPFIIKYRNNFHLTYTYERQRIKHVVFNEAWLKSIKGNND